MTGKIGNVLGTNIYSSSQPLSWHRTENTDPSLRGFQTKIPISGWGIRPIRLHWILLCKNTLVIVFGSLEGSRFSLGINSCSHSWSLTHTHSEIENAHFAQQVGAVSQSVRLQENSGPESTNNNIEILILRMVMVMVMVSVGDGLRLLRATGLSDHLWSWRHDDMMSCQRLINVIVIDKR